MKGQKTFMFACNSGEDREKWVLCLSASTPPHLSVEAPHFEIAVFDVHPQQQPLNEVLKKINEMVCGEQKESVSLGLPPQPLSRYLKVDNSESLYALFNWKMERMTDVFLTLFFVFFLFLFCFLVSLSRRCTHTRARAVSLCVSLFYLLCFSVLFSPSHPPTHTLSFRSLTRSLPPSPLFSLSIKHPHLTSVSPSPLFSSPCSYPQE